MNTNQTQESSSGMQQSGNENIDSSKSSQLASMKAIPNTPFTIVKSQTGYIVCWADYRLTDQYETEEEAMRLIEEFNWTLAATLMCAICDKFNNL